MGSISAVSHVVGGHQQLSRVQVKHRSNHCFGCIDVSIVPMIIIKLQVLRKLWRLKDEVLTQLSRNKPENETPVPSLHSTLVPNEELFGRRSPDGQTGRVRRRGRSCRLRHHLSIGSDRQLAGHCRIQSVEAVEQSEDVLVKSGFGRHLQRRLLHSVHLHRVHLRHLGSARLDVSHGSVRPLFVGLGFGRNSHRNKCRAVSLSLRLSFTNI